MTLPRPCVCAVTDRRALAPGARTLAQEVAALEQWLAEALEAGLDLIQIRERDLPARTLAALVRRVAQSSAATAPVLLVNDRVDVALAAGAGGVHLRGDGPPAASIRSLGRSGWIIGQSVHSAAEAAAAEPGADYLMFGAVFDSGSKPAGHPVAGPRALAATAAAVAVPVLAIGGITPERVAACREAGAGGVAGIGVFLPPGRAPGALGVAAAARALRAAWVLQ